METVMGKYLRSCSLISLSTFIMSFFFNLLFHFYYFYYRIFLFIFTDFHRQQAAKPKVEYGYGFAYPSSFAKYLNNQPSVQ